MTAMTPSEAAGRALHRIEHPCASPTVWDDIDQDARDWWITKAQPSVDAVQAVLAGALARAWDRGMADQLRLIKAGPGYEIGNPYRKAAA
jgi:predicted nuclease with RNAse H fold